MIQKVFILGNHIQALCLARQIKAMDIEVNLFTDTRYSISRFSNAVDETYFFQTMPDLMEKILCLAKKEKNILLFPTNDLMVAFLAQNYAVLDKKFHMGISVPETVSIFYDKRNTYQFAKKHGIPIPMTWLLNTMDDLKNISNEIPYPVVLKPAVMHSFHKNFGKKAFKCSNRKELLDKAREIDSRIPINEIIIQEYLSGGAKSLYSYGAFAVQGKPVASLMANRIRQNPMDFGNSTTYAKTCNVPEIKHISEKILRLANYFGLAEIEFMQDTETGVYKFLEINPRTWKWHSISSGLGFSFIGKMIAYLNSGDISEKNNYDKEVAWVERLTDSAIIFEEIINGRMKLSRAVNTYKMDKIYPVWSRKDMKPFFMYLILAPYLYVKRH